MIILSTLSVILKLCLVISSAPGKSMAATYPEPARSKSKFVQAELGAKKAARENIRTQN